ncbi:MAG: hypothetical protein K8F30_07370 [Taibaiella sp.]|nr:hypothetical protein [Taibaiella sp.]
MLQWIIIIWLAFVVLFNFYISIRYAKLHQAGAVINVNKRISLSILNKSIAISNKHRNALVQLKRTYIAYLVIFYVSILAIVISILGQSSLFNY